MRKIFRTPRQMLVTFVAIVNILSSLSAALLWFLFFQGMPAATSAFSPLIPLILTILITIPLSGLISKPAARPFRDMIAATKSISKGDYSIRVAEEGEGEIRELLHSFNQMTAELEGTELMRNDFINNFSHEFKTPIVSIRGFAKRLRQNNLTEEQRQDYLDYIISESERLADLSSNILLLSKYENQEIVRDSQQYELDEQIRRCILLLENQWEAKSISFDMDLASLQYTGNEEMMSHVWLNLIGNAIKFSESGGTIKVSASQRASWVEVSISDEGIGMSQHTLEHIFDKFFQGDPARGSVGNGLGLPLVQRIVHLCGGQITVESAEQVGTTFHISLPLNRQS